MYKPVAGEAEQEKPLFNGVIVMMDALGTRGLSSGGAHDFLIQRDRFKRFLELIHQDVRTIATQFDFPQLVPEQSIRTFGDTLICAYTNDKVHRPEAMLPLVGAIVGPAILAGLELELRLRGAVSVGSFVMDETTVVGQAITDAANWYERADWIGILCTPSCTLKYRAERRRQSINDVHKAFFDWYCDNYEVPLVRHNEAGVQHYSEMLTCLAWPLFYRICMGAIEKGRAGQDSSNYFHSELSNFAVPYGTEAKYFNTAKFFGHAQSVSGYLHTHMPSFYKAFKQEMFGSV